MSVELIKDLEPALYYGDKTTLGYSFLSNFLGNSEAGAVRPFKSTEDMRFGRGHHHVFLNRLIGKTVTVETHEIDLKTKAGKELKSFFEARHMEYFRSGEREESEIMCNAFFDSYHQDPAQKEIIDVFRTQGMIELTVKWDNDDWEQTHGQIFKFKSRLDASVLWPADATAWVMDFKTDGNLNAEKLYWKYRDMDYDLQMYLYCRALIKAGYRRIKYFTLSQARVTGDYCLSLYGDFDFSYEGSHKNMAFDSGEQKYMEAMKRYLRIQQKIKNKIPLSNSLTAGVQLLIHPSYEADQ